MEAVSRADAGAVRMCGGVILVDGGAGFFGDGGGLDSFLGEAEGLLTCDEERLGEALFAGFTDDAFVVKGGRRL